MKAAEKSRQIIIFTEFFFLSILQETDDIQQSTDDIQQSTNEPDGWEHIISYDSIEDNSFPDEKSDKTSC